MSTHRDGYLQKKTSAPRRMALTKLTKPPQPRVLSVHKKRMLQAEIKEAAIRVKPGFDPEHFVRLWHRYESLGGRLPVCGVCPNPDLCLTWGPRGPCHIDGACPAFPIEAVIPESPESRPSRGARLQEVEEFRQEVAAAPNDDPFVAIDRAALARFDREHDHVLEVS